MIVGNIYKLKTGMIGYSSRWWRLIAHHERFEPGILVQCVRHADGGYGQYYDCVRADGAEVRVTVLDVEPTHPFVALAWCAS